MLDALTPTRLTTLGSRCAMKCVARIILAAGFVLAFAAALSLLFCVVLVGSAVSKGYRLFQFVGYWPLFTVVLSVMSGLFLLGAPYLARAVGKRKADKENLGYVRAERAKNRRPEKATVF